MVNNRYRHQDRRVCPSKTKSQTKFHLWSYFIVKLIHRIGNAIQREHKQHLQHPKLRRREKQKAISSIQKEKVAHGDWVLTCKTYWTHFSITITHLFIFRAHPQRYMSLHFRLSANPIRSRFRVYYHITVFLRPIYLIYIFIQRRIYLIFRASQRSASENVSFLHYDANKHIQNKHISSEIHPPAEDMCALCFAMLHDSGVCVCVVFEYNIYYSNVRRNSSVCFSYCV